MRTKIKSILRSTTISAVLFCAVAIPARAATITVTNTNDSGPGSLRQALADATDGDTINFDPALNGQAIRLTGLELVIDKNISIAGPGPDLLAVCRGTNDCFMTLHNHRTASQNAREQRKAPRGAGFRIFHAMPGHSSTIAGLTIYFGHDTGAGIFNDQSSLTVDNCTVWGNFDDSTAGGGGIRNAGAGANLTVLNSTITGNLSLGGPGGGIYNGYGATVVISNSVVNQNMSPSFPIADGGGIENGGSMEITNSLISGNHAGINAGGISNNGMLTITNSTVINNLAGSNFKGYAFGGGISNNQGPATRLTITSSTVTGNRASGKNAGWGGGIWAGSDTGGLEITNTTISGNEADKNGGGIYNFGPLHITNSTFSNNSSNETAGAIYNAGTLEIGNIILNAGASGANIFNSGGTATSHGYNLSSDDGGGVLTGPGDQSNTNPLLGPLQDNGGPTFTHELLPGSPAIDAGDLNFTPPPFYDQRGPGFDRVVNGRIDIGSFEVQGPTPTPTPTPTPGQITLSARAYRVRGFHTVGLTWSGATSANIDVFRDGVVRATVPNTGSYTDSIGVRGGNVRYTYKVCEAGTSNCSNEVTVRFGGPPL
jgi:hypothetical protein